MSVHLCSDCGHAELQEVTGSCPVCASPADRFARNDRVFEESAARSKEAEVKHIPKVTINKKCGLIPEDSCLDLIVRIGAALHPMETAHFIKFIDCYIDGFFTSRVILTPATQPAACFHLKTSGSTATIVENCNIHGYWKTELSLA